MAEQGNPSIYDIDFAVLDEKKYGRAVKKRDPVIEAPAVVEVVEGIVEPAGRVALSTELAEEVPASLIVSEPTDDGPAEITINIPKPAPKPIEAPPRYVPPEYIELAQTTVDALLETPTKPIIPVAQLIDKALGHRAPRDKYWNLKNALKQDPRLEYLGSGDFRIVGAESSVVYWPGETPDVDMDRIEELSAQVLEAMEAATWNPHIQFSRLQVLGIVKGRGEYLSRDEQNELFAAIASNPKVTALEGGTFKVFKEFPTSPDVSEDGLRMVPLDFDKEPEVNDKPMSSKQIGKTMNKINNSAAVRIAADLGKRKANPRRSGKRKKKNNLQGRTHNKAQRQQQFIVRMLESIPPVAVVKVVTKVEEPEAGRIEVASPPETLRKVSEPVAVTQEAAPPHGYESAKVSDYEIFAKKHFGEFPDMNLLITAFTHRSYLNENMGSGLVLEHNERLEFLGDSILNAAVAEHLYRNYTDAEGMLTQWRTALTRNSTISAVAEREGFESLLRLSRSFKGNSISYIGSRKQMLANCYEAVLGAVYLTQGNEAVRGFVETTLLPTLDVVMKDGTWRDPKGRLQELLQGNGGPLPEYRVMHREGPDHNKVVVMGVYVNDKLIAEGAGNGSKEAQAMAAVNTLNILLASYK